MDVGTLVIRMAADLAGLKSDMDAARKEVASASSAMQGAVGAVGGAFKALAVVAGVAGLGAWAKSAIDAADNAFNLAQKLGVATSDVGGLTLAFEQANLTTEELKKVFSVLSKDILDGSKKFEALGISLKNTDGSAKSNIQVFAELSDRFASMKDGTDKTALAVEIFGKKIGPDLIPLLNAGSAGLADMRAQADLLGITISDETGAAADKFNDSLDLMKTRMTGVMAEALAPMLPKFADLAERMVAASQSSSTLSTVAKLLGGIFNGLVNTVLGVIGIFDALAIRIESLGKATAKFVTGDFAGASEEIRKGAVEIQKNWDALFGSQNKALEKTAEVAKGTASAATGSAEAALKSLAAIEEAEKAKQALLKATNAEYEKITETLQKVTAQALVEIETGGKITEAKKLELDVRAKLNDSSLAFTETQRQTIELGLQEAMTALETAAAKIEEKKTRDELVKSLGKENEDLAKKIEAQMIENAEIGKTKEEIGKLEAQRYRDAAATAAQNAELATQLGLGDELVEGYRKQAEQYTKLAEVVEQGVLTQAANDATEAWKKTAQQINEGLVDALMRAFESGKGFMEAFRDTLKNAFKTLILEPTIRAVMSPISGAIGGLLGSAPTVAGAAVGSPGGGSGLLGSVGNIASLGGAFGAGIAGGVGGLFGIGGASLGSTLGGIGYGLSGAAGLSGIVGSLGAIVGTLGPIALGIGVLVKAFSRGPKQTTAEGISGTIGGGEVDAQKFADWIKKGGWFRSDKKGTDYSSLSAETADALNQTAAAVFNQSKVYVELLGLSAQGMEKVNTQIRVQLGKDEAENEKAIAAAFEQYREDLANYFGEALIPFQKAGETLAETLERLAALQGFSESVNQFGGVFSNIATLSVSAKEELLGFAGGIEAFIAKTQSFVANYYSQDEQFGIQARQVKEALTAIGITEDVNSKADFRKLIESIDISTTEGRQQLNALLDLAATFAPLGNYLEEQGKTLTELIEAAPQVAILESLLGDAETKNEWAKKQETRDEEFYRWYRENWDGYRAFTDEQFKQDSAYIEFAKADSVVRQEAAQLAYDQQVIAHEFAQAEAEVRREYEAKQLENDTVALEYAMTDSERRNEFAQLQIDATDRLFNSLNGVVEGFKEAQAQTAAEISALKDSMQAGMAAVASATRKTENILDSWDTNGAMGVRTVT